ncbi:MAG: DUF3253 domain-containing protein [Pseudomonadota bacterium]
MGPDPEAIAGVILDLVRARGVGKSICPSEAARRIDPKDWRALMPAVRAVAQDLAAQGHIAVTQKGHPVDPAKARGPIRLAFVQDLRNDPAGLA